MKSITIELTERELLLICSWAKHLKSSVLNFDEEDKAIFDKLDPMWRQLKREREATE